MFQILPGNSNTYVEVTNDLSPPLVASSVRFVPVSDHPRTVCMRVELYGCSASEFSSDDENLVVRSYAAPRGDEFSPHVYLDDKAFDGGEGGKGLGVMTDGLEGQEVVFSEHGIEKGK